MPATTLHIMNWTSDKHWMSNARSQTLPNLREGTPHAKRRTEMDYRLLTLRSVNVSESRRNPNKECVQPVALSRTPRVRKLFTSTNLQNQNNQAPIAISRPDRCIVLKKLFKRIESANTMLSERCRKDEYRCGRRVESAPPLTRHFCDVMGPGLCNECTKCRERNISIIDISRNFKQMKTDRPVMPPLLRGAPARPGIKEYIEGGPGTSKQKGSGDTDGDDAVFIDLLHPRSGSFSSRLSNISSVSKEMTERTIATRKRRTSSTASASSQLSETESTGTRSRKSSVVSDLGARLRRVPTVQPVLLELKLINFTPYDKQSLQEKRQLDAITEDDDENQS